MAKAINKLNDGQRDTGAIVVPMDGFHFYRKELDAMSDPVKAHARRGAHWTFDGVRFVKALQTLKESGASARLHRWHETVYTCPQAVVVCILAASQNISSTESHAVRQEHAGGDRNGLQQAGMHQLNPT